MCVLTYYSSASTSILKKAFVFKSWIEAHDTLTIGIKCIFPKELRNGDFIAKPFHPFTNYLPLNFMLQFKKGKCYLKISNPTSKGLTIKTDTALGCVAFELIWNLSQCSNTIGHPELIWNLSQCSNTIWHPMCILKMSECPIHRCMGKTLISLTLTPAIFYTIIPHNHMTILPVPITWKFLKDIHIITNVVGNIITNSTTISTK